MAGKGGRRPGAGRKPKRLNPVTQSPIKIAELKLAENLPKLVDVALKMALDGDKSLITYCIDRVLGRPTQPIDLDVRRAAERLASATGADPEFLIRRAQQIAAENAEPVAQ